MAKAILSAPDSATRHINVVDQLWNFHSAYECIAAKEIQVADNCMSVVFSALRFANTVVEIKLSELMETESISDSDVLVLWGAYGVFECAQAKVVQDLCGDANHVSGALALLNEKFKDCIAGLSKQHEEVPA